MIAAALKKVLFLALASVLSITVFAQQNDIKEADFMRSNGRIYVVIAVMLTILIGLIFYVIRIDRKLSRLEKNAD